MALRTLILAVPVALLAACSPAADSGDTEAREATATETAPTASPQPSPAASPPAVPTPLAADLVRAEWAKAENRATCAPIAFTTDGGVPATARRANFAGGWAVAFDTPDVRSAYGVAGAGMTDGDEAPSSAQAERLGAQWPHFTTLAGLPAPAFAGYGLEGAEPYPADNPAGTGLQSLAYVRVGGEGCTYNVWSRMGREHLETLLASLRKL